MRFIATPLENAYIVEIGLIADERGFFARSWCREEFQRRDLNPNVVQCNISFNERKGTLRGLHYQEQPCEEAKLIRCSRGAIYDVIVNLRPASHGYMQWYAVELTAENRRTLYVPEGLAHGFQTLEKETEVFYQMSSAYRQQCARGIRWGDPAFGIRWPVPNPILSEKDQSYRDFRP